MAQKKVNYPLVGVIMGSTSDWETMREACEVLDELNVSYEKRVVSALNHLKEMHSPPFRGLSQ